MIVASSPRNSDIQILGQFGKPQIHKGILSNLIEILIFIGPKATRETFQMKLFQEK